MKALTSSLLLLLCAPVFADPDADCSGNPHHCGNSGDGVVVNTEVSSGDMVGGDVNLNSKAIGLANNLGDVDINDCRESVQFGTPLFSKQNVRLNPWCAAEVYDAKGMYKMAAIMRCEIKEVRQHFENKESCLEANVYAPAVELPPPPPPPVAQDIDRDEEDQRVHEDVMSRLAALEKKREEDAKRAARYAQAQQEFESEQRAYAQEALAALEKYK